MRVKGRLSAVLAALMVTAGCQALESRVQQFYADDMAKNFAVFDKIAVQRAFPVPLEVVDEALDRILADRGVLVDNAKIDFTAPPVKDAADKSRVQTNSHVKFSRTLDRTPEGHRVATTVVSNWYQIVGVKVVERNDGCELSAYVHGDEKGRAPQATALLDLIGQALGQATAPGVAPSPAEPQPATGETANQRADGRRAP